MPEATERPRAGRRGPPASTRVCLEIGSTWVFATALDWPGWCRRGRGEEHALECLLDYEERYRAVAGGELAVGPVEIVGRSAGNRTTDFGAPGARGSWDDEPLEPGERERLVGLLEASWRYFDDVVAAAPGELSKGPRGGGRDRDRIVEHVREAERAYAARLGARVDPRTPWTEQRATVAGDLRSGRAGGAWPARYAIRRIAWHVLDHAWEIEDKSVR